MYETEYKLILYGSSTFINIMKAKITINCE